MKELFLKIWKDPVWSKVISAAIIAFGIYIWSLTENVSFIYKIKEIYNAEIKILYIFYTIITLLILRFILRNRNKPKKLNKKQQDLASFRKLEFKPENILVKWDVSFVNNNPLILNIQSYCNKHNTPLKLYAGKCIDSSCINNNIYFNPNIVENQVESHVEAAWDRINSQV